MRARLSGGAHGPEATEEQEAAPTARWDKMQSQKGFIKGGFRWECPCLGQAGRGSPRRGPSAGPGRVAWSFPDREKESSLSSHRRESKRGRRRGQPAGGRSGRRRAGAGGCVTRALKDGWVFPVGRWEAWRGRSRRGGGRAAWGRGRAGGCAAETPGSRTQELGESVVGGGWVGLS